MVDVVGIQQREEHVDVEERSHQSESSSRSLLMSSLETAPPRGGNGSKPKKLFGFLTLGSSLYLWVSASRASSDRRSPALRFCRRALSLTASRTSSAISRVVRMHQMLAQRADARLNEGLGGQFDASPLQMPSSANAVTEHLWTESVMERRLSPSPQSRRFRIGWHLSRERGWR